MCDGCPHYATAGVRILIIKLAALGDVLRTTVILPGIKQQFPDSTITWLTAPGAADLVKGNPLIDELWSLDAEVALRLAVREFDVVFSPDADPHAAVIAAAAKSPEKRGLFLHPRGHVLPANVGAETWFEMGAFDQVKKANQRTYQSLIYQTLKLDYRRQELSLVLRDDERAWARTYLTEGEGRQSCGPETDVDASGNSGETLPAGRRQHADAPVVGLNLGGGGRWKKKQWKPHHFETFARRLIAETGARLLLIGGRQEAGLLNDLQSKLPAGVLSSGPDRSLRETASLIGQCAVVVTGDSLALHIASALRVPTVVLLGPTSAAELELYDRGEHVIAPIGCVNCYLTDCSIDPDCMQLIQPKVVLEAVKRWLK